MNPFVSFLGCEPSGSAIHTLAFADVWLSVAASSPPT